jgi:hypothetical protein
MAYEIPGQMVTLAASTTLTQYTFKDIGTDGRLLDPAGSTAPIFGVLQNKPTADQAGTVMISGISKVIATASTLAAGDLCASSTDGEAIPVAAGDFIVGRVVGGSSGGAGRVLSVEITPIGSSG